MKQKFDFKLRLNNANKERLAVINSIIEGYAEEGYVLSLRQLFYQLVKSNVVANTKAEYIRLSNILKKGRMAGIVDWSSIEDRTRKPRLQYWVHGVEDAMIDTIKHYKLDRMRGQKHKIEIWIEKDALSSIFARVANKYHIRMMVNKGYSSISAMYDASRRLSDGDVILYFGDFDPSGLDMIRDIEERLELMNTNVDVRPIGLTLDQVRALDLPPNYAKVKDPRYQWYEERYGDESWEIDSLTPGFLVDLTEAAVLDLIDVEKYKAIVAQERKDKQELINKFELDYEL